MRAPSRRNTRRQQEEIFPPSLEQRPSWASGVPMQYGSAVKQASAYSRDQSRQALQHQRENCESIARLYEAAARDKILVAIAGANVEIQYLYECSSTRNAAARFTTRHQMGLFSHFSHEVNQAVEAREILVNDAATELSRREE